MTVYRCPTLEPSIPNVTDAGFTLVLDNLTQTSDGRQTSPQEQQALESWHNVVLAQSLIEDGDSSQSVTPAGSDSFHLSSTGHTDTAGQWAADTCTLAEDGTQSFQANQTLHKKATTPDRWVMAGQFLLGGFFRAGQISLSSAAIEAGVAS